MRCFAVAPLALGLSLAAGAAARADAAEARAVVDRAIKAAGGEAKLAGLKTVTLKAKARLQDGTEESEFSGDCSFAELDSFAIDGSFLGLGLRGVVSRDGAWRKLGERIDAVRDQDLPGLRKLLFAMRAGQMLVPLKDQAVTLSHGGEGKVGDRPAIIVKATHKDHGEVDFYFDKETGLPAKFETPVVLGPDRQERPWECVFSDHKAVDGLRHPTKITMSAEMEEGRKTSMEIAVSDVK